MTTIATAELETVSGGVDWRHTHQQAASYAARGAVAGSVAYGTLGGLAAGPVGAVGYGITGAAFGAAGGYLAGMGKGIYETWDK